MRFNAPVWADTATVEDKLRDSLFRWRLTAIFFIVFGAVAVYRQYKPVENPPPITLEQINAEFPLRPEDFPDEAQSQSLETGVRSLHDLAGPVDR